MHDCPECGMACDCDGEDTWLNAPPDCQCDCRDFDDDEFRHDEEDNYSCDYYPCDEQWDDYKPSLWERFTDWWHTITYFSRCSYCGKMNRVFGKYVGNHIDCIPF
jgi:hypothetical protein